MVRKRKIVDYSDRDYREYWTSQAKDILHRAESGIFHKMLPDSDGWFIDIGCGFGRFIPEYDNGKRKIILVDWAINHLEMVAEKYKDREIYYVAADGANLPFQSNVIKSGICIRLFHYINNPVQFISEISRILKNQSHFLITYINKRSLLRILRYGLKSFTKGHDHVSSEIIATHPAYFIDLLQKKGLSIIRKKGTGFIHQLSFNSRIIDKWINNSLLFRKLMDFTGFLADMVLGLAELSLIQYNLVRKTAGNNERERDSISFFSILRCPKCHSNQIEQGAGSLHCRNCKQVYKKYNQIYDLRLQ